MPLARIILGGLNVVAAIAFMALAAMSYGARYHRTYNVFRYDLAIQGLPVDDAETDAEGQRSAAKLTPDTLKKLFPSGNPVSTQKAEVEARYAQLQADLGGLDDAARQKKLVEFLKPLVRTFSEREALSTLKSEELQVLLDQEFEGGRTGKGPDGKELNLDQRRQAIARVLFNLAGPDDSAQQRVVTVVGLASYVREADRQTTALQDLALNQQKALATDQALFEIQHKQLLQRILVLAERVGDVKATLAQHQDMNKNHQTLLAARQADVKKFEGELDTVRKLLGDALAEQADLERHLFTTQRALGEAKEKNEQLDREIRSLEQKFRSREAGQ